MSSANGVAIWRGNWQTMQTGATSGEFFSPLTPVEMAGWHLDEYRDFNRMKRIAVFLSLLASLHVFAISPDLSIWLEAPAKVFTESLPLGNGRLGAMDFGGIENERVALNEDSLWSGSVQDADRTNAAAALPEIRRLLLEGKNLEAEELVNRTFTCAGSGSGYGRGLNIPYGSYEVLGDLRLQCHFADTNAVTGYRRELDLSTATGRTEFSRGGKIHTRYFCERAGPGRCPAAQGGQAGANYL